MASETISGKPIESRPEFAGIIRDEEQYAGESDNETSDRLNGWFDTLMIQSGLEMAPSMLLAVCMLCSLMVGGLIFVITENLIATSLGVVFGLILPVLIVMGIRTRRQTKIMNQMPPMIEELARAARTGRSLDQCLHVVAADTPAPLGTELQHCTRKMQMGMRLSSALADLPRRTGLVAVNVLVMALGIHEETGGDLVSVLERLSQTIRDRLHFVGRLRAATAASRATAILMLIVPPAVFVFFMIRDPNYFNELMASSYARGATVLGIILQIIGAVWVLRILKTSQRT